MRQIVKAIKGAQAQAKFNGKLSLAKKMRLWSGQLHRLTGLLRRNQPNEEHIAMASWLVGRLTEQFSDEERELVTANLKQGSLEQRWAYAQKLFLK